MNTPFRSIAAGLIVALGASSMLWSQAAPRKAAAPVVGKSLRYCNPLPIPASSKDGSPQGVVLGDVTVVPEGGQYYMFCSGGGGWVSKDLVNWDYKGMEIRGGTLPVAPHVVKYNGAFYLSGNNMNSDTSPVFRAPSPLGPYEVVGNWTNEKGQNINGVVNGRAWKGSFDVDIFIDDDNKPYLYYPGRSSEGIYAVPLNPNDLTKFEAAPTHLFGFNKELIWERYGERHEYSEDSWIEGPWVIKNNGTYYLQHSAGGTRWTSYATGVYTAKSPLGPFTQSPVNPVMQNTHGLVTGPGHGCVVKGPDGNWWQFYTVVFGPVAGGRRIGMDPVSFDKNGNMAVRGPTDTPQWGPGAVSDPYRNGNSRSIPLTEHKVRVGGGHSTISSERPGHEADYATDDHNGTWWEPAEGDAQPSLSLDLSAGTEWAPVQLYTIDSSRIIFAGGASGIVAGTGEGRGATPQYTGSPAFRYKIETSQDGKNFTTILDKTRNNVTRYIEFDELPPTVCRYVRLTITDWPRREGGHFGIIEFTAFGKPVETRGPRVARGTDQ
jgi:xylan 1,4-beta-xylosidase